MPDKLWQAHEDERLRAGWPTESIGVIGKALGRSRSAVVGRAGRIGLPPKPKPLTVLEHPLPQRRVPGLPTTPVAAGASAEAACKKIFELALWDCHWPIGDPRDRNFTFCGAPALRPYGYCTDHQKLNFNSR